MKTIFNNGGQVFLLLMILLSPMSLKAQVTTTNTELKATSNPLPSSMDISDFIATQNSNKHYIVLDVRIEEAYAIGHISGARFIGPACSQEKIWMLDKEALIIVVGDDATATQNSAASVQQKGFKKVQYLVSSLQKLTQAGVKVDGTAQKSDRKSTRSRRKR